MPTHTLVPVSMDEEQGVTTGPPDFVPSNTASIVTDSSDATYVRTWVSDSLNFGDVKFYFTPLPPEITEDLITAVRFVIRYKYNTQPGGLTVRTFASFGFTNETDYENGDDAWDYDVGGYEHLGPEGPTLGPSNTVIYDYNHPIVPQIWMTEPDAEFTLGLMMPALYAGPIVSVGPFVTGSTDREVFIYEISLQIDHDPIPSGRLRVYVEEEGLFKLACPLPGEGGPGGSATTRLEVHSPIGGFNYTGDTFYGEPVVVGSDPWADDSDGTYAIARSTPSPEHSPSAMVDLLDPSITTITAIRYFIRYSTAGTTRGFFYEWWPEVKVSSGHHVRIPYFQNIPGREYPAGHPVGEINEFTETMFPDPTLTSEENVTWLETFRLALASPMTVNFWALESDSTMTIYKTWIEVDYESPAVGRLKVYVDGEWKFAGPYPGENDGFGRLKVYVEDEGVWKNA